MSAHTGVLAAASSLLKQELSRCERGTYRVCLPLTCEEMDILINFAYTGETITSVTANREILNLFCDDTENTLHADKILSKLYAFDEKGLFCDVACHTVSGLIQPCHSYLMAAKYDFLSDNIRSDSIFYLKLSSNESGKSQIGNNIAATSPHLEDEVNVAVDKLLKANIPTQSLNTDMQINVPVSEPLDMMKHIDVDTPLPCLQNETASQSAVGPHFWCHVCLTSHTDELKFVEHKLTHFIMFIKKHDKPYVWSICSEAYGTGRFQKHKHKDTTKNTYVAPHFWYHVCLTSYTDESIFKEHQLTHVIKKPYIWSICSEAYVYPSGLKRHERRAHGGLLKCPLCSAQFADKYSLKRHLMCHIGYECPVYKKTIQNIQALNPLTSRPECMPGSRYTGVGALFFVI